MEKIKPAFDKNNIPIVFACDNNYVPYTSVMFTSFEKNISDTMNYDILLFQKDITEENKVLLNSCLNNRKNVSLRFIDISEQIKNFNLRIVNYYTIEIYFRLFAPWVLSEYDKILYFDCDLVFNADISKLYGIDIGDNFLGVVRDLGMLLHKNNPKSGIPKNYYTDFLCGIEIENYFNSGVLIMNLKKFRDELNLNYIMNWIQSKEWHFPDQDVLNVICAGKTYMLPMNWNTIPENSGDRKLENLKVYVPEEYYENYLKSREKPYIIHYAMREKPWKYSMNLDWNLGQYFWKYAFVSPVIDKVLNIKSKTCSLAEIYKLVSIFDPYSFCLQKDKNDIRYLYKGSLITKYSSKIIKFETAEIKKDCILIDGWFEIGNFEEQVKAVYLSCGNYKVKCTLLNKNETQAFDDVLCSERFVFKGKIPLDKINDKKEFKLMFEVGNKYIYSTSYNYGRFFPTDRIFKNQYFYKNGFMLQTSSKSITIRPASKKIARKQEKRYIKELKKDKTRNHNKSIKLRKIYNTLKKFCKKQIWLVSDNFISDDNGMAFFEYLYKNKERRVKVFFAISRNNKRYDELKAKYKKKVLTFGTRRFKLYSLLADAKISSIVDFYFIRPFKSLENDGRDIYAKQNFVFLQHGVISNDMSREHNKFNYNPVAFVTSAKLEQQEIQSQKYFYEKDTVILTGLTRFDKLYNDNKKYITIMPTWRKYLIFKDGRRVKLSDKEFKQTNYFKFYFNLLNNEKLNKVANQLGFKICFMQHPLFKEYDHCFENEKASYVNINENHRDVFAHSSLVLSDYSSTIFDFLYLRKPIVYTHFDKDEFYSGAHAYDRGFIDHENDGFGECEFTLEGTVDRLCEYMQNDCLIKENYLKKVDEFFAYSDKCNSERTFNTIFKIVKDRENINKSFKYYVKRFKEIKKKEGLKTAIHCTKVFLKKRCKI